MHFIMTRIVLVRRNHNPVLSSFMTYHRVSNRNNTMVIRCGTEAAYTSGAPEFIIGY